MYIKSVGHNEMMMVFVNKSNVGSLFSFTLFKADEARAFLCNSHPHTPKCCYCLPVARQTEAGLGSEDGESAAQTQEAAPTTVSTTIYCTVSSVVAGTIMNLCHVTQMKVMGYSPRSSRPSTPQQFQFIVVNSTR